MRRVMLLVIAALAPAAALAQLMTDGMLRYSRDGVNWAHSIESKDVISCRSMRLDDYVEPGMLDGYWKRPPQELAKYDCHEVRVRNDWAGPIQCRVSVLHAPISGGPEARIEGQAVLYPRFSTVAVRSAGLKSRPPVSFTSECFAIPRELPPERKPDEKCRNELSGPAARDFYPEANMRLREEGDVTLEYSVDPGSDRLLDVRVIAVSGYLGLDNAALKLGAATRNKGGCANVRYRAKVRFRLNS